MRCNRLLVWSLVFLGCGAESPTAAEAPSEAAGRTDAAVADVGPSAFRVSGDPLADPLLRRALEPLMDLETVLGGPRRERPDAAALLELLDARTERPDDHDATIARAVLELTLSERPETGEAASPRIR